MHIIVMILVSVLGGLAYLLASYLGYFKAVDLERTTMPELVLLFDEHMGPYHETVQTLEEVEAWAKGNGLKCERTFGHYLDNPETTEDLRLRSHAGCVINAEEMASLNLKDVPYKIKKTSKKPAIRVLFQGSPGIGPLKVYPEVERYLKESQLTRTVDNYEIYHIHPGGAMTTLYYFPLTRP